MYEQTPFDQLQDILLRDTRNTTSHLNDEVREVRAEVGDVRGHLYELRRELNDIIGDLDNIENFNSKVEPVLSLKLLELKRNFGKFFGYEVKEVVKNEIRNSKDEFVEAFYPIMGKLIRRYMHYEVESWFNRFTTQVESAFTWQFWRNLFWGGGESTTPQLLCYIEEVFVIAHGSGLLIGSYSKNNTADMNMVAGMLTAVKSFMGEVFQNKGDLNTIDYAEYKIFIHDNFKYYFAVVVAGLPNERFKTHLRSLIDDFAEQEMPTDIDTDSIDDTMVASVSDKLKHCFENNEL